MDGGRWTMDGGRWTTDFGQWTVDDGLRNFIPDSALAPKGRFILAQGNALGVGMKNFMLKGRLKSDVLSRPFRAFVFFSLNP